MYCKLCKSKKKKFILEKIKLSFSVLRFRISQDPNFFAGSNSITLIRIQPLVSNQNCHQKRKRKSFFKNKKKLFFEQILPKVILFVNYNDPLPGRILLCSPIQAAPLKGECHAILPPPHVFFRKSNPSVPLIEVIKYIWLRFRRDILIPTVWIFDSMEVRPTSSKK